MPPWRQWTPVKRESGTGEAWYMAQGIAYTRRDEVRTLQAAYAHPYVKGTEDVTVDAEHLKWRRGYLTIHAGFEWDGASGPTRDRWFCGRFNAVRGPLVHDAMYVGTRLWLGVYTKAKKKLFKRMQKIADKEFYRVLTADGMPWWRRNLWYWTVRLVGFRHITGRTK